MESNSVSSRDDYRVNIQLPKKEADSQEVITITGLEEDAEAAKVDTLQPCVPRFILI